MKILMEWIFFSFFMHYKRIWEKKSFKKKNCFISNTKQFNDIPSVILFKILNNIVLYILLTNFCIEKGLSRFFESRERQLYIVRFIK